jgi:23S rRNA (cytosine1962-C5)-methyltransferase
MKITVLHQDDDIVVVNKPAGLPTHAADPRDPYPGDALRIVQAQLGLAYLGMHQRLDADTSGVLLFSARPEANRSLSNAFESRNVSKVYVALVRGQLQRAEGVVDAPLAREREGRYRVTSPTDPRAMSARTRYRVVRTIGRDNRAASLIEVMPETGRTHQIRVHLAHLGHPVIGDVLYGREHTPAPRLFLHAHRLTLPHPITGDAVSFTAPLPEAFRSAEMAGLGALLSGSNQQFRDAIARAPETVRELVRVAVERRGPLAADPNTTLYRLVNGGGDRIPGLTIDRYGDVLVASVYDDDNRIPPLPVPQPLIDILVDVAGPHAIYVKHRPRAASRLPDAQIEQLAPPRPLYARGLRPIEIVATEEGLRYLIRPGEGLSTGLFGDMREGRARVRAWAAGLAVLNCFAYTCGFGLAAIAGGATRTLNLDLSKSVLAWGQENYRLNGFEPDSRDFVFGDVFDWLARLGRRKERFDLVVLDPPGFSRTKTRRFSAAQDYDELVALATQVTAPSGRIFACSNVAEQPWRAFRDRVLAGVQTAGRQAEVHGVYHEPAIDFPTVHEPYLKLALLQLD